jgi:hypothetical protein
MKTSRRKTVPFSSIAPLAAAGVWFVLAARVSAAFVGVVGVDVLPNGGAGNDPLFALAPVMDELGDAAFFPVGETLTHIAVGTPLIASPVTNTAALNALVTITNTTALSFTNLHYVGSNPTTVFTNIDETINGMPSFRIDMIGVNMPLKAESGAVDGIFSPGESWSFVVDDYASGAGLAPDAFFTPGIPDGPPSSASIVADIVPEPASLGLLALATVTLAGRRTRKDGGG